MRRGSGLPPSNPPRSGISPSNRPSNPPISRPLPGSRASPSGSSPASGVSSSGPRASVVRNPVRPGAGSAAGSGIAAGAGSRGSGRPLFEPSGAGYGYNDESKRGSIYGRGGSGPSGGSAGSGAGNGDQQQLKLVHATLGEWALSGKHISIGRQNDNDIKLTDDPEASRKHCVISDGVLRDLNSFNGTFVNEKKLDPSERVKLRNGDKVRVGATVFNIQSGAPADEILSRTKEFPGLSTVEIENKISEMRRIEQLTVEELMEEEFAKIIGHDEIKKQLRRFHKKVQLDKIRDENHRLKERRGLYHMIFSGPPGTGKTSMANLVARVMLKMGLVQSQKVVFVNNALELLAGYAGQTPAKVDAKVEEAKGGVLFIDEAYSIVKSETGSQRDSFGKEAIETLMKHLDPPSCVFIFAGYEDAMEEFLRVNDGLARRIPYRYAFEAYTVDQLVKIAVVMCESKGERLAEGVVENLPGLLESLDEHARKTHNAGLVSNLVSFAQIERDKRIDIDAAAANPEIAYTLEWCDFEAAVPALINTFGSTGHDSGSGSSAGGSGSGGPLPQVAYAQPEYEFDE